MTKVRRINVSQIEGDTANNEDTTEIRPYGDIALYQGDNNKLELLIADGIRTNVKNKVLAKGTFYGGDADSGDGAGFDTIKLIPDEVLRRNGSQQYLVIDPTFPNHIHIRAGGTQDSSSADLFVGGEQTHVKISDSNDTVTVRTSQVGEGVVNRDWVFDNLGGLTFPMGGAIEPAGMGWIGLTNGVSGSPISIVQKSINVAYTGQTLSEIALLGENDVAGSVWISAQDLVAGTYKQWSFGHDGKLVLPGMAEIDDTPDVTTSGTIITVPLNAAGDTEDYVGGASVLEIPKNADTNQVQSGWIITFINGGVQRTVSSVVDGGSYWAVQYNEANPGLGAATYPLTIQSANYVAASIGTTSITKGNYTWSFDTDGDFIIEGFVRSTEVTGLKLAANYDVSIIADYTDNNREWTFSGGNGTLTVPGSIKSRTVPQVGTRVTGLPYTLGAGANNGYVGIGPEWAAIVALGDLTGYTLYAMELGAQVSFTLITQMRDDLGGQPAFQTFDPLPAYTPDITFILQSANYQAATDLSLELEAGNKLWEFDPTGNLIIPLGGTINWYDGSNALVGGSGIGMTGPTGPQGDIGPTGPAGPVGSSYSNANVAGYLSGSVIVGDLSSNGIVSSTNSLIINSANGQAEGGQITIGWKGINGITGQSNSTWNMDVDDNNVYRLFYQNAIGGTNVMLSASPTTNIVTLPTVIKTTPVAFASLPDAATAGAGARAFVTDSTVTTFGTQVTGGGIYYIPVFSNGTNWYVG